MPPTRRRSQRVPRSRAQLSLEAVVEGAIGLLDEAGESALTFRALAARLGGGVGSIYWYVQGRDELLDRATDTVVGRVLDATVDLVDGGEPIANLRDLAVALYDEMRRHPWLAPYLMRDFSLQPNCTRLYERFGRQLLRLDLTTKERFYAVSAVINYVTGVGAELNQEPPADLEPTEEARADFLVSYAQAWRGTDPSEFPFLHEVADEFARHRDEDQFTAGLDLLLDGLRAQAGAD